MATRQQNRLQRIPNKDNIEKTLKETLKNNTEHTKRT